MWIVFGLISPFIYTISNFIDKYLLSNVFKDYRGLPIYTALVSFIFGSIVWIIAGFPLLPLWDAVLVLLTGVITIWSFVIYFKALSYEETSKIIILFQLIPLFSLCFGIFFLKESISIKQTVGFIGILFGSMLITIDFTAKAWKLPPTFILILLFDLMVALSGFLMKFVLNANSFWHVFSYESFGIGLGGLILFLFVPAIRKSFFKSRKKQKKSTLGIIVVNEMIFLTAKSTMYYAFTLGPLALVSVLGNTQVFFGIIIGILLTVLYPNIFKENISPAGIRIKIISSILLFISLYLLV